MKGREAFGYVVTIEGPRITLNLKDTHKGHFASHRGGVSPVTEINGLFGVNDGSRILVLRVNSLSFIEPREVHKSFMPRAKLESEPLRQLNSTVVGWLWKNNGKLQFTPDSLSCPVLGAEAFPLSDVELSSIIRPDVGSGGTLCIGTDIRGSGEIRLSTSELLGRHVAILGSTGQGKSCFTAAVIQQILKMPHPRIVLFDINGEFQNALNGHVTEEQLKLTTLGGSDPTFKIPYYALGRHGLTRLLMPSERTQRPALSFAIDHLCHVKWFAGERGAGTSDMSTACLFDDCRTGDASMAGTAVNNLRNNLAADAAIWPHMSALGCLVAESHSIKHTKYGDERDSFHYSNVAPLITRIKRFIDDPLFTSVVQVAGGPPSSGTALDWHLEGANLVDNIFGASDSTWKIHLINLRSIAHDLVFP